MSHRRSTENGHGALPATQGRRPQLLSIVGLSYFPIAFIGRLPFAMTVVGVVTLMVTVRDSFSLAGFASATVGLGTALAGPFIGMAADRVGQRAVLLVCTVVHATSLVTLTILTYQGAANGWLLAGAFMIGASAPQLAAMSRARLLGVINSKIPPVRRSKTLTTTMSIESVADELVFVFGPVAVGLLAVSLGSWAPLGVAAILTLVFVGAFALHPTSLTVATGSAGEVDRPPLKNFLGAKYLVLIFAMLCVGSFFGSMFTALTGFMEQFDKADSAGVIYGALGVGSAIFAMSMPLMPGRFSLRARLVTFAGVMLGAVGFLPFVTSELQITVVLVFLGVGIGPVLVTIFSIASIHGPSGRTATLMTLLSSSIVVGQAALSATTGQVVEHQGVSAALLLPVIATFALTVCAVANFVILKAERPTNSGAA